MRLRQGLAGGAKVGVPTYRPTLAEFEDFERFVRSIEPHVVKYGLCKVIPPAEWRSRAAGDSYGDVDFVVKRPIQQHRTGSRGAFEQLHIEQKSIPLAEFKERCAADDAATRGMGPDEMESRFWRNAAVTSPVYGADMMGTLMDDNAGTWNMGKLKSILGRADLNVPGVTCPYLYVGAHQTSFAWHVEDVDLNSINYLHTGREKTWYSVPASHGHLLEQVAAQLFPELEQECTVFLRHKTVLISPAVLARHGIPVYRETQRPGEFMITMPYSYHSGFNHGFNIAEAVNFATPLWLPIGSKARLCKCSRDVVRFDDSAFARLEASASGPDVVNDLLELQPVAVPATDGAGPTSKDASSEEEAEPEPEAAHAAPPSSSRVKTPRAKPAFAARPGPKKHRPITVSRSDFFGGDHGDNNDADADAPADSAGPAAIISDTPAPLVIGLEAPTPDAGTPIAAAAWGKGPAAPSPKVEVNSAAWGSPPSGPQKVEVNAAAWGAPKVEPELNAAAWGAPKVEQPELNAAAWGDAANKKRKFDE